MDTHVPKRVDGGLAWLYNYMEGNFMKARDLLLKLLEVISLHTYFVCHNQLAEISKESYLAVSYSI